MRIPPLMVQHSPVAVVADISTVEEGVLGVPHRPRASATQLLLENCMNSVKFSGAVRSLRSGHSLNTISEEYSR